MSTAGLRNILRQRRLAPASASAVEVRPRREESTSTGEESTLEAKESTPCPEPITASSVLEEVVFNPAGNTLEEDLEVSIVISALFFTFLHSVMLILSAAFNKVVYHLGPGDVRLGPLFEFTMTLVNLGLVAGIWQRKRTWMQLWQLAAVLLMFGNLCWTVYRIGHGEAWGLTFIIFDFLMLVTYMAVCKNVYDLHKVQEASPNYVIVMDVIDAAADADNSRLHQKTE